MARPSRGALAATLLVGVTICLAALARAERHRRAPRSRRAVRERHFGLLAYEAPARGLERIALSQLDLAVELLRGEAAVAPDETVHETRKALKRLRALLRLLEDELGRERVAQEQAVLREAAARLAGARDAEVMVRTLEQLLRRHPRRLRRRRALIELREALERERVAQAARAQGNAASGQLGRDSGKTGAGPDQTGAGSNPTGADPDQTGAGSDPTGVEPDQTGADAADQTGADLGELGTSYSSASRAQAGAPSTNGAAAAEGQVGNGYEGGEHAQIAADLAALRISVGSWKLPDRSLEQIVGPGMQRVYRKGRRRWMRAAARTHSATALHRWRKEVKDLRYVAEVVDVRPSPATPAASKRLTKLAQRADTLGELLGEEHDLALLAERARKHAALKRRKRARRALLRAIARRRARLRKQALRAGAQLYGRKPKRFARRVRAGFRGPDSATRKPRPKPPGADRLALTD